jgi:hypothetical protein
VLFGAGVSVTSGVVPALLPGIPVQVEVRRVPRAPSSPFESPAFVLGFERTFDGIATATSTEGRSGDVAFHLTRLFADVCPLSVSRGSFRASPCATIEGGALAGEGVLGKSLVSAQLETRAWASAGLAVRASQRVLGLVSVGAEAAAGVPLVSRYEFQLDPNLSVGKVKAWNFRVAGGVSFHFL